MRPYKKVADKKAKKHDNLHGEGESMIDDDCAASDNDAISDDAENDLDLEEDDVSTTIHSLNFNLDIPLIGICAKHLGFGFE